jgi:hypothetical protein
METLEAGASPASRNSNAIGSSRRSMISNG